MLIGRKVGHNNPHVARPGAASLVLTGNAPTVSLSEEVVTLLLNHFNGSDGAGIPADEVAGITWTQRTDLSFLAIAELDTAFKVFGTASLYFPLTVLAAESYGGTFTSPHAGSWSVNARMRPGTDAVLTIRGNDASDNYPFAIELNQAFNTWSLYAQDSGFGDIVNTSGSITLTAEVDHHVAVVRDVDAGTYSLYIDGSRVHQTASATDVGAFDRIAITTTNSPSTAWVDEIRVTNGVDYTGASYTVPTSEFIS